MRGHLRLYLAYVREESDGEGDGEAESEEAETSRLEEVGRVCDHSAEPDHHRCQVLVLHSRIGFNHNNIRNTEEAV